MRYKQDLDVTVPGTPRTFLLMPRGLKNSAAPTAAHSQSPWPEHCSAWESCRACDLRQGWGEARTQPPSSTVLGKMIALPLPLKEKQVTKTPQANAGRVTPCLTQRDNMKLQWLSGSREKLWIAFLEAAPSLFLEESWGKGIPKHSFSP